MINNIGVSQTLLFNDIVNDLKNKNIDFYNYGFGESPFCPPTLLKKSIIKHMDYNSCYLFRV